MFFFFSSRRRHTRLQGDWSSDVCSSDLCGKCERPECIRTPAFCISRTFHVTMTSRGDVQRIEGFMKVARALLLMSLATGLTAQTWDTSGNGMLNGQYYFRHVLYQLSSTAGDGTLSDAYAVYGTMTFNGTGAYTMAAIGSQGSSGQAGNVTTPGTYSIAASGQGFLSNPLSSGDSIQGLVNAQGIFVGSSTENLNGYNDVFIAAPLASPLPTASLFKGSYTLAYMDLSSGTPTYTTGGMLQMNPDGVSNVGTVGFAGY